MATSIYSNYKPHRQEGFHLPSPAPSTPPSSDGTPANNNSSFDTHNLFISPPSYLSVPETFRKFPPADHGSGAAGNMDFTDELASLITHPHPSSHERSTQSPVSPYDDYRPSTTHNIFDISAPTSHHHHHSSSNGNYGTPSSGGPSAFSLPPSSSLPMHTPTHPLHEFTAHAHFNSTVPAIGSSMRYEPPSSSHGHSQSTQSHPFALNTSSNGNASTNGSSGNSAEPSSVSSFSSHLSGLSSFSSNTTTTNATSQGDFLSRQTPSPTSNGPPTSSHGRSRSRSRSSILSDPQPPPSTNGGPARRTRTKRGSVSSVSPPPLHRGLTQPLVIPPPSSSQNTSARSPLGMHHTSGWFHPGSSIGSMHGHGLSSSLSSSIQTNMGIGSMGEFSLPTPDSVHGGFSAFGGGGLPPIGLSGSPKDIGGMGMGMGGKESPTSANGNSAADLAAKQAAIANEKRRRRRESHNAVERRRRDNINEKISELATLIPECLLDPNATMTMPASLSSATSEDLLLANGAPQSPNPANSPTDGPGETVTKKEEGEEKDGENGGVIKANKGMILRKSVEYIRYLQQLVSAQASRNRDLEQQLQQLRLSGNGVAHAGDNSSNEDDTLMLHEEIGDDFLNMNAPTTNGISGHRRQTSTSSRTKKFTGFELDTVAEMEQDTDHDYDSYGYHRNDHRHSTDDDHEMDRPSTGGMGGSPLSNESASDEPEGEPDDRELEERGRKGRDGRPMGLSGINGVKTEEGMETS